jgi:hypothetical protein
MNKSFFIIYLFIIPTILFAQEYDETKLEEVLELISDEHDLTIQLDQIEALMQKPIDLRKATKDDLILIPGISIGIAEKIISEIRENDIKSILELSDVINLSDEMFYLLSLCTYISENKHRERKHNFYARGRSITRFSEVDGFERDKFLGDKLTLYQRYNLYYDGISSGIVIDKDEGEKKINDFMSGFLALEYFDSKVIVGDYYLEIGMGNLFWKSFGSRKGSDVISPALQWGSAIVPYRSSLDADYFRGAAFETEIHLFSDNSLKLKAWYSNINRAGSVSHDDVITSIYEQGYYRTESEISKRDAVNEQVIGGNLEWQNDLITIGTALARIKYDKTLETISKSTFLGREGMLKTAYLISDVEDLSIGTELSQDAKNNIGLKIGSQLVKQDYMLAAGFRSFASDFRSPFGYNFGEQSYPSNETGFYFAGTWKKYKTFNVSTYIDIYSSKKQTYYVPFGLRGIDMFSEIWWKPHRKTEMRLRLRYEDKTDSHTDYDLQQKLTYQKIKPAVRLDIRHNVNTKLYLRLRGEISNVLYEKTLEDESGYMSFLEMGWQPIKFLKIGGRYTIFSTDSYESAIWQYEYAMPGYMTTVPLYGDGIRAYFFIKITPIQNIIFSLRTSYTRKNNTETLGSGYLKVLDNEDVRAYMQLDIRL